MEYGAFLHFLLVFIFQLLIFDPNLTPTSLIYFANLTLPYIYIFLSLSTIVELVKVLNSNTQDERDLKHILLTDPNRPVMIDCTSQQCQKIDSSGPQKSNSTPCQR